MKKYNANIEAILIADNPDTFVSRRIPRTHITLGGIEGDRHFGITSLADSRQPMYPRGTTIFNRRQLTITSVEECMEMADCLGVDYIDPEWLGANVMVSGFPNLTNLPIGSRMILPSGAGLLCMGENKPCTLPGEQIQVHFDQPNLTAKFVKAGFKRRGIVCLVEVPGLMAVGDEINILENEYDNPMQ
ncbi:MOSC domain-containing protein [Aquibacillus kalidii]|uniref:MOSC domain-containing protein n=1 Tax=Aquibacillus kalidii TaxID=2762597 RepID=UPI001646FDB6|nr:MOSC domain-containing protein [Aquibacillus kalidii]